MRTLAIAGGLLVAATSVAVAGDATGDTFEARAAGAVKVPHIDDIVWALTTPCDKGDDTQQRQCRRLRDARASQLANATMLVDADRDAFSIGTWSPQKKSAALTLTACIKCSGVVVDGQTWFVIGNKEGNPAPRFEGGKLKVGFLLESARTFPSDASAKQFAGSAANAKIQLLVKIPAKAKWADGGKQGIALDVLGFRVYSPCDGAVVFSSPKAGPGEVDKKACLGTVESAATPPAAAPADEGGLTPAQIKDAAKPILDGAKECYAQFKVAGKAKLRMVIDASGALSEYQQQGDFVGKPTGTCIDRAVKTAAFPKSKKARNAVALPITLP